MMRMTPEEQAALWRQLGAELRARYDEHDKRGMTDEQLLDLETDLSNEIESRLTDEWYAKRYDEEEVGVAPCGQTQGETA